MMSEGTVHVHRHVPLPIPEGDVRTHRGLGHGLSADVFLVGDVVVFRTVFHGHQSVAMRQQEHAQGFSHDLHHHVARTVESGTVEF